ncbi:hypothetical protein Moror_9145 [Moniliophthora roreri MCA 2997]|nr:hypothetical protein Moror_9145 [Moniliophthora roreri MCA 2997]
MNTQLAASCVGLSLTFSDMYFTRKEERALVWRYPSQITTVKALYLLSRYMGLACQLYNFSLSATWRHRYHPEPVPLHICASYAAFKGFACCGLLATLHIILMLRVYALYGKSLKIGIILILIYALRHCAMIWAMTRNWDVYMDTKFDHICTASHTVNDDAGTAVFVIGEVAMQVVIHALTVSKTSGLAVAYSTTPTLVSILNRDGLYVLVAIFGALTAVVASSYEESPVSAFICPLFILLTSCAGCRVILNLRKSEETEPAQGQDIMFSTIDSAWDTMTTPRNDV